MMHRQEPTGICKNKKPANRTNTRSAGCIANIALFPLAPARNFLNRFAYGI